MGTQKVMATFMADAATHKRVAELAAANDTTLSRLHRLAEALMVNSPELFGMDGSLAPAKPAKAAGKAVPA